MNSDTQEQLERLVEALENQEQSGMETQRSFITQPERVFITSDDDISQSFSQDASLENSFASFTVNLKRPALNVKSLQVSRVSIPNPLTNIPDTETTFWYRKLFVTYLGGVTIEPLTEYNLFFTRLLPSYYKPELFGDLSANIYGFNRYFSDYQDLETELAKSCAADASYSDINNNRVQWENTDTYNIGDVVIYDSRIYFSLQNANLNHIPANTIGVYWLPSPFQATSITEPDISLTYDSQLNKFQMTGLNSTNFKGGILPTWSASSNYTTEKIILLSGTYYANLVVGNSNNPPATSPTFWYPNAVGSVYLSAGYNDPQLLESQQDLQETSTANDYLNLALGIPGQPYQQYKTLNNRLGFTWDGISSTVPSLATPFSAASSKVTLLNRLRPLPKYISGTIPLSKTLPYYTAECPACLVHTSIVNLYGDIAGGSTSDSGERGQALLATVPMASSTLGVVFYNPTIYNALTKISDQIYQITIEMRTENGNLFYLPNSAIVTLEFTLTY